MFCKLQSVNSVKEKHKKIFSITFSDCYINTAKRKWMGKKKTSTKVINFSRSISINVSRNINFYLRTPTLNFVVVGYFLISFNPFEFVNHSISYKDLVSSLLIKISYSLNWDNHIQLWQLQLVWVHHSLISSIIS